MPGLSSFKPLSPSAPSHRVALANYVRELLVGVSYREASRRLHCSGSTISRLVDGYRIPTYQEIDQLVELWASRTAAVQEQLEHARRRGYLLASDARTADSKARLQAPERPGQRTTKEPTVGDPSSARPQNTKSWWNRSRSRVAARVTGLAVVVILAAPGEPGRGPKDSALGTARDLVPLQRYWDGRRLDNLITTEDPNVEPFRSEALGYHPAALDGYALSTAPPALTRCLVQVVRFVGRQADGDPDHATTTDPGWLSGNAPSGYVRRTTLGYIYNPNLPGLPDARRLYRLYSPQRGYLTTSEPRWAGHPGDINRGYVIERIEGYVLTAKHVPPPCPD